MKKKYNIRDFELLLDELPGCPELLESFVEMDLIYQLVEGVLNVTPALLQSISIETIDAAIDIMHQYSNGFYADNEIEVQEQGAPQVNRMKEMQLITSLRNMIEQVKHNPDLIEDEDYF